MGDFNIPISEAYGFKQKTINKDIEDSNNIINNLDLIAMCYITLDLILRKNI